MDIQTALQTVSKAIGGALAGAIIGLAARFGFDADQNTTDALGIILTALVSAGVGFISVYLAPKNKEK